MKISPTKNVIVRLCLVVVVAAFLAPLVWVIFGSVSPQPGSSQSEGWGFANYQALFSYQNSFWLYALNSVLISVLTIVFSVVVSTLAGYSFSRYTYPGKNLAFVVTLSILMVPYAALLIPLLVWLKQIGLNNSLVGVALVISLFQLPLSTFIMRVAFDGVPREMEEAAMVDGAGSWQTLVRISLPAVRPSMITIALLAFLEAWNNFMIPLYLLGTSQQPLPLAMVNLRQQAMGVIDYGVTEAGVVVLLVPAAVLFLVLQRYYVRGFAAGALKG